ncbi:MAG TPA: hypothetical protein VLK37_08895 [Solirubrobacterales bacterium]|nr:hypothetical protein [Solirubrobacterales bacterium]
MAHIAASSDEGPRADPSVPAGDRNKYENLILLCPNHHEEIDGEEVRFPADALKEMKAHHEQWVNQQLAQGQDWREELSTVDYVNVPRMLLDPAAAGLIEARHRAYLAELTTLRDQGFSIGTIAHILGQVVENWQAHALPLASALELGGEAIGARISFEETFWTKNMTGADKQKADFTLSGDIDRDPHIYVKKGGRTVLLPLDPRWVTTSTAFATFTSGNAVLAGVGLLRAIWDEKVIVSPLVIGAPPLSPAAKAFEEGLLPG